MVNKERTTEEKLRNVAEELFTAQALAGTVYIRANAFNIIWENFVDNEDFIKISSSTDHEQRTMVETLLAPSFLFYDASKILLDLTDKLETMLDKISKDLAEAVKQL